MANTPRPATRAWAIYALSWFTFGLGFAALFWYRDRGPSWVGTRSALIVMLPAALLGVVVVKVCRRINLLSIRGPGAVAAHLVGALAYPLLWIGSTSLLVAASNWATTGRWAWRLAPEHVLHWHYLTGVLIYTTLAAITYGLEFVVRSERLRQHAEWQLLRAQLNPHFLFNTLHALFALTRTDAERAERGLDRFSNVLRYSLHVHRHDREWVSLREEWEFTRDYLTLEALRFGDRLRWEADVSPEALACAVPPVSLQPLVENAIRFAVDPRADGASLVIRARVVDRSLELRVEDDGPGCVLEDALRSPGVGLRSIRARLSVLAPGTGRLRVDAAPGRGFAASIQLPVRQSG